MRDVSDNPGPEELGRSQVRVGTLLSDFQAKASAHQAGRDEDLRGLLSSLAEAVGTLATHGDRQSLKIKQFAMRLQLVSRGTDLGRIREDLAKQVAELREFGASLMQESAGAIHEMQAKLTEFQGRLEQAARRASVDAVTGLLNRGEGEARLRKQLGEQDPSSVILIDLNGFKQINDRWGHGCGDQVLRSFASLLANSVRAMDMVCRWGGDEFLVLLRCTGEVAEQRAAELRVRLTSCHKLSQTGKTCDVVLGASVGVAASRPGETLEMLIERADADLYTHKSRTPRAASVKAELQLPVPATG